MRITRFKIFGRQYELKFSLERVKRVEFSIPDWADDAHLRQGGGEPGGDWDTTDGKTKITYYKGSTRFEIDVPECKKAVQVSVSPLYKKQKIQEYATDRKVVVDLYY